MIVEGLIQAAGSGTRLGHGPKAFVTLGGQTLLERAIALLRPLVAALVVAVPAEDVARARALVGEDRIRIIAGAESRSQTTRDLIAAASAPWLLLHDVVHPFATPELVAALLDKACAEGACAPGLINDEFVYNRAGELLYRPGELLIGQKPVAFSRQAACAGYDTLPNDGLAEDPSFLDILERGGVHTAFIPGGAANIKITTPDDLRLARAFLAVGEGAGNR